MGEVLKLTADYFDRVIAQNNLVVVDFWAKWCVPCQSFAKTMEFSAQKYPEVVFASVDVDVEKTLAEEFGIRSIPRVMIFREQVVVYDDSGVLSSTALSELIDQAKKLDMAEIKQSEGQGES